MNGLEEANGDDALLDLARDGREKGEQGYL
jgi:hypothetical protein